MWKSIQHLGVQRFMFIGLLFLSISFFGLFYIDSSFIYFQIAFIILAIAHDFGAGMYWIFSNSILFKAIGTMKCPGRNASFIYMLYTGASILSAIIGVVFDRKEIFSFLFLLSGILLLLSMVPLRNIDFKLNKKISLKRALRNISSNALIGNLDLETPIKSTALPLILLLFFSSISESIFVISVSQIIAAIFAYLTGFSKDKKSPYMSYFGFILSICVWFLYGVASAAIFFIALAILESVSSTILSVDRTARLSRDVVNTGKTIETAIVIEIFRQIGPAISFTLLLGIYQLTNTLDQFVLIAGSFLILPKALYAMGGIERLRLNKRAKF